MEIAPVRFTEKKNRFANECAGVGSNSVLITGYAHARQAEGERFERLRGPELKVLLCRIRMAAFKT